ncbi:Ankyrin repeat domain-containing protein 13B [Balamuthia mandrillaris]
MEERRSSEHHKKKDKEKVAVEEKRKNGRSSPSGPTPREQYALHKAVWKRDLEAIERLIEEEGYPLDERDAWGNPPLHLAIHFRYRDVVKLLLRKGADPTFKNGGMWSPIQEAVASGDPKLVGMLLLSIKYKVAEEFGTRAPELVEALQKLPDFYLELKWEFRSWVPLVSRFCPHDTYKVWKKGSCIRVDTTLVGFDNMKAIRGNVSILFRGNKEEGATILALDHDRKSFEHTVKTLLEDTYSTQELQKDVNEIMAHTIVRAEGKFDKVTFTAKTGWMGGEREEAVGPWHAKLFDMDGFELVVRHRNSKKRKKGHVFPKEDVALGEKGGLPDFDTYFSTRYDGKGKGMGLLYPSEATREKSKGFKGTVWLCPDFPRKIEELVPLFAILSPKNKHFERLQDFMKIIPDYGFPVRIEIPVFPTVSGSVTFGRYEEPESIPSDLFEIPSDYKEVQRPVPKAGSESSLCKGTERMPAGAASTNS